MPEDNNNGWVSWSKHVLKELERLNEGQTQIKNDIQDIKTSLSRVSIVEEQIKEIKNWKNSIGEVYSPTQLAEHKKEIEQLKSFKTKAVTVFAVVQFLVTIILTYLGMG